jgi:DNA-binding NtrC family response regulator
MSRVLIVEDQPAVAHALEVLFGLHELPCEVAAGPAEALSRVASGEIGVVVQDMNFSRSATSGAEGIALFREVRRLDPQMPVLLMTAWTSLETAVTLVREGAADYVAKPWDDNKLLASVRNLLQLRSLQAENLRLKNERNASRSAIAREYELQGVVYESDAMHRVVLLAVQVAASEVPVLVTGPHGAGKEKIAEIVQANSRRRHRPFIRVNVGALPDELLESELFGAEAGAYTGSRRTRIGRFEAADGGTIFLDEIGEIGPSMQVKLLRVLQEKEVFMLGSRRARKVDVRILAASNKDLQALVKKGTLREDLFFRINVLPLEIPPLRKRGDDVLLLARHFASQFARELEKPAPRFTDDALRALRNYDWPGNVRELENVIQRLVVMLEEDVVDVPDLPSAMRFLAPRGSGPYRTLAEVEAEHIQTVLAAVHDNKTRAAEILGIDRKTLRDKITRGLTTTSS